MTKHIYSIAGLAVLITTVGIGSTKLKAAPPAGSTSVTVNNTAANPLPTMSVGGTVSVTTVPPITISGTPNINVANTPNVNVANTPTVKVSSSVAAPIIIRDSAAPTNRQYVSNYAASNFPVGDSDVAFDLYTVPVGKQLEVKDAYCYATGPSTQITLCNIGCDFPINIMPVIMTLQGADSNNNLHFEGAHTGQSMILPAGTTLKAHMMRNGQTSPMSISAGFDGYLEDAS